MLGLKRGAVALCPQKKAWETEAEQTMARLRQILGPVAVEMVSCRQHGHSHDTGKADP